MYYNNANTHNNANKHNNDSNKENYVDDNDKNTNTRSIILILIMKK